MRKGRYIRRRTASRMLTTVLALLLVVGLSVGGTLAWLTAQTEDVTNTFTVGDINIDLKEHTYDPDTKTLIDPLVTSNTNYKFVPGDTLPKDPFATVKANSEKCYLFIEVTEDNNTLPGGTEKIVDYTIDATWTKLTGVTGVDNVWFKVVDADDEDQNFNILTNKTVSISENVLKTMYETLNSNKPALNFKAYAIQYANLNPQTEQNAWALIKAA